MPRIVFNSNDPLRYHFFWDGLFGLPFEKGASGGFHRSDGIPVVNYKWGGPQVNPAYVALWGLNCLHRRQQQDFETAIAWLHANAQTASNETRVWHYGFDWVEGRAFLKAPWISAMSQGLAVSALVRSYRLSRRQADLDLALAAARIFQVPVADGGVLDDRAAGVFLEEYPAKPYARILDGFCFAVVGLLDLLQETCGEKALQVLAGRCLDTIEAQLPAWEFMGCWSWYGREGFLCDDTYHRLNRTLLTVLARVSGREGFDRYARKWNPARLNRVQRKGIAVCGRLLLTLRRHQYNRIRRMRLKGD